MCMEYTTLLRLATVMQRDNNNSIISLTVMPALKTLSPRWCLSIRMTLPPCRKEHKNKINFLFSIPPSLSPCYRRCYRKESLFHQGWQPLAGLDETHSDCLTPEHQLGPCHKIDPAVVNGTRNSVKIVKLISGMSLLTMLKPGSELFVPMYSMKLAKPSLSHRPSHHAMVTRLPNHCIIKLSLYRVSQIHHSLKLS